MGAKHLTQGLVEQVCTGMVGLDGATAFHIHTSHELGLRVLGQFAHDMDSEVVLFLRI